MKKVHVYIMKEFVAPFFICLLIFTFIIFAREVSRLAELFIGKNVEAGTVLNIALSILPSIFIFTLPMSFFIAVILGFSRLSSDGEIVALKASGIAISQLLPPTLFFGSAVWLLTTAVTLLLFPKGNAMIRQLTYEVGSQQPFVEFRSRVFNEDLPNLVLYIHNISSNRSKWEGIFLADNNVEREQKIILAQRGTLMVEPGTRKIQLHLENGTIYKTNLDEVEKDNVSKFMTTDLAFPTIELGVQKIRPPKVEELSTLEVIQGSLNVNGPQREFLIELNTRLALPMAAWIFGILGITLGVNTKRGGRAYGFVIGIFLCMLYYNLFLSGKRLAGLGRASPLLGVWSGNLIFLVAGALLFIEVNRESSLRNLLSKGTVSSKIARRLFNTLKEAFSFLFAIFQRQRRSLGRSNPSRGILLLEIISLYVSRGFFGYFILSLIACSTVFIIFTLFSLVNDIIRNNIPIGLVVDYFRYMLPQILLLLIPIAILLGTLINFGILEKSNQVTAFKASGISLYRLAIPIFMLSLLVSGCVYLVQEYVEPYANQRQDSIRHIIKGRPPQTAYRPEKKWIFGENDRIFNYAYFDPRENVFAGFGVVKVDFKNQAFRSRVYAQKATWNAASGWILENGWVRNFESGDVSFRKFTKEQFYLPEQASYFREGGFDPKETSKMTYAQLSDYIALLRKSGFDVALLKVELYKKISIPLAALIMSIIAVPFSFSMGRRGAFYGVAIGIMIGIAFWGTINLFETLGSYGLLAPVLAAWAPNVLFGALGLYLLFTIKT